MGRPNTRKCQTCRIRKVKCDGGSPACRRCIEYCKQCPGYSQVLEFVNMDQKLMAIKAATRAPYEPSKESEPSGLTSVVNDRREMELFINPLSHHNHNINLRLDHTLAIPQNKASFISFLEGSYVPIHPVRLDTTGTTVPSNWMTKACSLTTSPMNAKMLDNALLAMSLALASDDNPNGDGSRASLAYYSEALVGLRNELQSGSIASNAHAADVGLVTGLSCGMYEMMANRSFESMLRHLSGVGAILTDRGVDNIQTSISRRTFYEFRSIYLPIALVMRRPNFLSQSEWINPPWKKVEPDSRTLLQSICDYGFRVPLLMEIFDRMRTTIHTSSFDSVMENDVLITLARDASSLQDDLNRWDARPGQGNDMLQFYIPRIAREIESPRISDMRSIFPISFDFPSWDTAAGLIYRDMIRIFFNSLVLEMTDYARLKNMGFSSVAFPIENPSITLTIEAADRICQSIEFFLEDNKRLIGRMIILAPLECARAFYQRVLARGTGNEELDVEIRRKSKFCEQVTKRIQEGGLPLWAKVKS